MFRIYPKDQMKWFLFLDISLFVFLFYNLMQSYSLPLFVKISLYIIIFACYYFVLFWKDWRFFISSFIGIATLAVLAVYINESMLLYLFIFSDASGRVRSWPYLLANLLMITFSYIVVFSVTYNHPLYFIDTIYLPFLFLQLILPFVMRYIKRVYSLEQDLEIAQNKLAVYAKEEERSRIARDLHDTLGHTLTVIKFKSELAIRLIDQDQDRAKQEMSGVLVSARNASKQVREVVTALKHIKISDELTNGFKLFKGALTNLIVMGEKSIPALSEVQETMLALSIREVFVNCYKHSQADRVTIEFKQEENMFKIPIKDDGIGIDSSKLIKGEGFYSMRERMKLIKGHCEWISKKNNGTTVILQILLNSEE